MPSSYFKYYVQIKFTYHNYRSYKLSLYFILVMRRSLITLALDIFATEFTRVVPNHKQSEQVAQLSS